MPKYRLYGTDSSGKYHYDIIDLSVALKLRDVKKDVLEGWKQQIEFHSGVQLVSYDVKCNS